MLLKELILQTKYLEDLYVFYKDKFLLEVKHGEKMISINAGKTTLIFQQTNDIENPFYHFAFNIPCNKIEEALHWLKDKVEILWIKEYKNYIAEFTAWNARSFYFIDPAGNIVELIARFDLHDEVDKPFSAAHIRNISETGIVFKTEQFNVRINKMLQQHQLEYFSKQPPLPHFKAIGDDEGLFIVVPEKRNWYPTNIPAQIFPLTLAFENNKNVYRLEL